MKNNRNNNVTFPVGEL